MTTTPTASPELPDLDRLEALARAATPGPWETETVRSEGEYGTDEDGGHGFDAYAIVDGKGRPMMDSLNRDDSSIHTECTGDAFYAWDELAKRDAHFIAAANPAAVLALIALARRAQPEGMSIALREVTDKLAATAAENLSLNMANIDLRDQLARVTGIRPEGEAPQAEGVPMCEGCDDPATVNPDGSTGLCNACLEDAGEPNVFEETATYAAELVRTELKPALELLAPAAQHAESGAQAPFRERFKEAYETLAVAAFASPFWDQSMGGLLAAVDAELTKRAALAAQSQGAQAATCKLHAPVVRGALVSYKALARSLGLSAHRDDYTKASLALSEVDRYIAALAAKAEAPAPSSTEIANVILRLIGECAMDWKAGATGDPDDSFTSDAEELRVLVDLVNKARAQQAAAPGSLEGRTVSVDVSTGEHDAGNRIFAELTGETGSDGTTLLAIEKSRNFSAPGTPEAPAGWNKALHAAVSAIYFDDSSDFRSALGSVVRHLDADLAGELLGNPKAAYDRSAAQLDGGQGDGEKA